MQTVSTNDLESKLASVVSMAREEPVMVERDGQPFVVMLSAEEYKQSKKKDKDVEDFIALCDRMAKKSTERGMTEEILNAILSER